MSKRDQVNNVNQVPNYAQLEGRTSTKAALENPAPAGVAVEKEAAVQTRTLNSFEAAETEKPAAKSAHSAEGFPGMPAGEQAKDLFGSWKKLLIYSRKYLALFLVALVCASLGTVFTLIGPNKLSEMTDTIAAGIAPNEQKMQQVLEQISGQAQTNAQALIDKIKANLDDESSLKAKVYEIMSSPEITAADRQTFIEMMQGLSGTLESSSAAASPESTSTGSEAEREQVAQVFKQFATLPPSITGRLFPDFVLNGVTITTADQLELLATSASLDLNQSDKLKPNDKLKQSDDLKHSDLVQQAFEKFPVNVLKVIWADMEVDGTVISGAEQQEILRAYTELKNKDQDTELNALEKLPDSLAQVIATKIDKDAVVKIGLTLVFLYVFSYILSAIQGLIMATVTQKISKQMRSDISRKINRLPMWVYNRTTTGDILSRVTNDVDTIGQSLNMSIGNLLTSLILFIGCIGMMFLTNLWMTLATILASLLGFFLLFIIMGKSQKYFSRQQKYLGELNGHIEEMYTGHTVVKAYNGEAASQKAFDQMNRNLCDSGFKAQCLSGLMMPIMFFTGNLGYVAICVVGSVLVAYNRVGFGVIVAFMMYVRYFTQSLSQIAQSVQSIQSAAAAGERVFEFLENEEMESETGKITLLEKPSGKVEFKRVKFGYEDSDETVIHDFSALARPGQKIAIVGPTGAGKTTMVNLLMRFHEIQAGEILIDDIPISQMTREAVHAQFCMVLQDTWLFEGSVRENLVYNSVGVSEAKITQACKEVGIDHFIRTLPKGYDTVLNDQVSLSQGQKQQLTIARAMLADKPMLILDEATSSVDTRTEQQIQTAMDKLMLGRTSFVIAHRLSTIRNSDLILVMKNGDIIESGTHEALLAQNGFYAELYNTQFEQ